MQFTSITCRLVRFLLIAALGLGFTCPSFLVANGLVPGGSSFVKRPITNLSQESIETAAVIGQSTGVSILSQGQSENELALFTSTSSPASFAADQPPSQHRLIDFFLQLVESTTAHILAVGAIALGTPIWLFIRKRGFSTSLGRYCRDLQGQMALMPFIYQDLKGEVLNDFVQVELIVLDNVLRIRKTGHGGRLRDYESLRLSRRIIFLGMPGIGKTTFARFAILSLLKAPSGADFVYPLEGPIPVYVPLKLVDNNAPFPIVRFLLKANNLFNRNKSDGLRRLQKYAAERRIFLFLDGYDEISTNQAVNYLRQELTSLFGSGKTGDSEFDPAILALRSCRIWLSSRREFFETNFVRLSSSESAGPDTVATLEVTGVGENRVELVKNIFDKYRTRNAEFYTPLLNEEYFVSDIDRSAQVDIRKDSYNPLLLTVLCYLYVTEVQKQHKHDVVWIDQGLEDYVIACVKLLLNDLDEAKARDLPPAHREGLLRRRNEYPKEKEAFLEYFAFELIFHGTGAFTLMFLRTSVVEFLETENLPNGEAILIQMRSSSRRRPDVALQMVYAGIFVLVSTVGEFTLYDFPVQTFRHSLALRYVATPPRYCRALLRVGRLHFEEFSRLLQASPKIRNRDFQKGVLEHILHLSVYESDPERDVATSRNFFCLKPHDVDVTQEVKIWLLKMARDKSPQFDLAREVLGICSADRDLAQAFLTAAEESIEASAHQRLALSMRALELEWPTLASQFLKRQWSDPRWIAVCVANPQTRCNFLYLVASKVSTGLIDQEALLAFRRVFPAHFHVELLGFVWRFFPSSFGTCVGALKINAKEEWLDFMSALGPGEIDEIIGLNPVVFIRTRSALSEIRNKVQEVPTRFVRLKGRNMNDTGALSIKELREYRLMDMKPALDLIAAELDQKIGTRVERWNELVEALRKDYQQWLEVTRLHDRSASQGRTEVKSEGLFEWLIGSVCDEVSVNAQTLRELNGAMVACHYTPRKLPGYFI